MSKLYTQIEQTLLPGMYIPKPIKLLFEWIEAHSLYVDTKNGRLGFLFPEEDMKTSRTKVQRNGGTDISFASEGNVNMKYWFGHENPSILNRICVFAKTGSEGSMAAFWLDDNGNQNIVHMGSGSGSSLVCVLAENSIDFLRLIAIGYEEICWSDHFQFPPNHNSDFFVYPNTGFQNWVKATFNVSIPHTASEIVKYPCSMDDENPADKFAKWVEQNCA